MAIRVEGCSQQFVETSGLRFSYLEWGSAQAPPMVLLHGLTGLAHMWDVFAGAFQDEYHILALDQRGHGDTQWPDPPSYVTDDFVEDLTVLARIWAMDRFMLIGLSMGAHNSLAFASKEPEMVTKLIAIDIPPDFRRATPAAPTDPAPTVFASIDEMFARAREANKIASDEMIRHRVEHNARQLPDGRRSFKYSLDAPRLWQPEDLWGRLGQITCPTLVVRGGESNVLAPDIAEREAAAIPNGRLLTIPGSGHPVPMDRPVELEAAVRAFLEDGTARA